MKVTMLDMRRLRHRISDAARRTVLRLHYSTEFILRNPWCCGGIVEAEPIKLQVIVLGSKGAGKTTLCLNLCIPDSKSKEFESFDAELSQPELCGRIQPFSHRRKLGYRRTTQIKYVEISGDADLMDDEFDDLYATSHATLIVVDLSSSPSLSPLILHSILTHKFLMRKPILVVGSKADLRKSMDTSYLIQALDLTEIAAKQKTRIMAMTTGIGTKMSEIQNTVTWFTNQLIHDENQLNERIVSDIQEIEFARSVMTTKFKKLQRSASVLNMRGLSEPDDDNDATGDIPQTLRRTATFEDDLKPEVIDIEMDTRSSGDGEFVTETTDAKKDDKVTDFQLKDDAFEILHEKMDEIYSALKRTAEAQAVFAPWTFDKPSTAEVEDDEDVGSVIEAICREDGDTETKEETDSVSSFDTVIENDLGKRRTCVSMALEPSWVEELEDDEVIENVWEATKFEVEEEDQDGDETPTFLPKSGRSLADIDSDGLFPLRKAPAQLNLYETDQDQVELIEVVQDPVLPYTTSHVEELNVSGENPDLFSTPVKCDDDLPTYVIQPTPPATLESPRSQPQIA